MHMRISVGPGKLVYLASELSGSLSWEQAESYLSETEPMHGADAINQSLSRPGFTPSGMTAREPVTDLQKGIAAADRELRRRGHTADQP